MKSYPLTHDFTLMARIITCLSVWLGLSACATDPPTPTPATHDSLESSTDLTKLKFPVSSVPVRWNPSSCEAPPAEILLTSGWQRVIITQISDAKLKTQIAKSPTLTLLNSKGKKWQNGRQYPSVSVKF